MSHEKKCPECGSKKIIHDEQRGEDIVRENIEVEQHPDGDKKDAAEGVPQGKNIGDDLMAEFRLRDHETGNECPQGQGKTRFRGQPCRAQAKEDDKENKKLTIAQKGDLSQNPGQEPARGQYNKEE